MLRQLTELPGAETSPDISPDGRQIVYSSRASGQADVYLLRVGGARAINLTEGSTSDDLQAAFSADGERIAFRSERDGGGIFVMGSTGESVRRITSAGFDPAWSPDGKTIAYATEGVLNPYARHTTSELWTAPVATGQAKKIFAGDAVQPAWSPDGRRIAFWSNIGGQRDLWTIAAEGGTPVAVTADAATDWSPEWSPDGRSLYFSTDRGGNMNIWRVAIGADGTPAGDPEPVTRSFSRVGYARITADSSRLSVMAYTRSFDVSVAPFDAAALRVGASTSFRTSSLGWCSPSSDGGWLVCTARGAQEDIVLVRSDGSETIRLMDDAPRDRNPTWSPDGSRITFMSTRSGRYELWSVRRDGSDLRAVTDLSTNVYEAAWSTDGKQILTGDITAGQAGGWLFDATVVATKTAARLIKPDFPEPFHIEAWSPDMKTVAGAIIGPDGSGRAVAVMDLQTTKVRRFDVPVLPGQDFRIVTGWLPDSRRFLAATRWRTGDRRCRHGKMDDDRRTPGRESVPPECRQPDVDGRAGNLRRRRLAARTQAVSTHLKEELGHE